MLENFVHFKKHEIANRDNDAFKHDLQNMDNDTSLEAQVRV